MTKDAFATALHYAAYVALGGAALIAMLYPVVVVLLALGAGLFFFSRQVQRSS